MPKSENDTIEYQLFPRVVPEGWSGRLRLSGLYAHNKLTPGVKCSYALRSMRWHADKGRKREPICGTAAVDKKGELTIPFEPDIRGEWVLTVTSETKMQRVMPVLGLFVIQRSMRKLRPYIGDLHTHSTGSDGRQEPAYAGIRARECGYDFLALSDHNNFHASAEMIRKTRGKLGRKMLLMRGEELHASPHGIFHYLSVGHTESIEDIRRRRKATHRREVQKIVRELRERETVARLNLRAYAEGLWKFRKARELGGTLVFCHPYWSHGGTLCLDDAELEQSFLDREFDAVEVFSTADYTDYMVNRVTYEAEQGRPVSVVGVSDCHNWGEDGNSGQQWTYVMAEALTQEAVLKAVRERRSLACANFSGYPRFVGPMELVEFADFYHRRLLPQKRRLMRLEAAHAFSALRGGAHERGLPAKIDRELERLERKLWA